MGSAHTAREKRLGPPQIYRGVDVEKPVRRRQSIWMSNLTGLGQHFGGHNVN